MSKPVIHYDPHGETGNIFRIVGQLKSIMRKQRRIDAFNQIWERIQNAGSYEAALAIIGEEVELKEEKK